jgi:NAD(P)-dependent dehydrogenase (short-subunit alcohol dehydrogenase family)
VRAGVAPDVESIYERGKNSVPLGFMGDAMDVANATLWLASDASRFTTGLEVPVDGGTLSIIGRYQRPPNAPKS